MDNEINVLHALHGSLDEGANARDIRSYLTRNSNKIKTSYVQNFFKEIGDVCVQASFSNVPTNK